MNSLNGDEFDTIFEMVVCVMLMAFGAWATAMMVQTFSARTVYSNVPDKIEITNSVHYAEDPMWFTGYQAYMFAWHMDHLSYEDLYYVSEDPDLTDMFVDSSVAANPPYVKLSVYTQDVNGKKILLPQFYTWRNQMITGRQLGTTSSVKKTLDSAAGSPDGTNQSLVEDLYKGDYLVNSKHKLFHLELTDKTTLNKDAGNDVNAGGKKFKWTLIPKLKN